MTRWLWLLPLAAAIAVGWLCTRPDGFHTGVEVGVAGRTVASIPASGTDSVGDQPSGAPAVLELTVLGKYPHDSQAFTQGLLWHEGKLYETTGHYGRSRLRRVDLDTGAVEQEVSLAADYFGEGLTLVPETGSARAELLWLTWRAGRAFRFDLETFELVGEHTYQGQGWGLCWRDGELYRSDGTSTLWRHGSADLEVRERLQVTRNGLPVDLVNELECTPEGILANVWQSDEILRIDPTSGRVTATADASDLIPLEERGKDAVLNGIAYRSETGTFFLTGKNWPWLFEVALEER
ncbi:MAG: glutaminyl-peptide cyclotransferase [Thermoanaerobaculia bacterium]